MSERAATIAEPPRSPPHRGLTSVIVIAADSGPGLVGCIERVLANDADVEAIVVDNASRDGAVDAVTARFAEDRRVRVVRNASNVGFGAGCNRGATLAAGDALLFLNPDCEIPSTAIATLRAALAGEVGLVGAAIVDAEGHLERASRRRDPTLRRVLMTVMGLARFETRWPALAGVEIPPSSSRHSIETVDAVSGALMLMPRGVFQAVGGFDEGYFLHAEDLDLCRRVRDHGYTVVCATQVCVVHHKGGSSRHRALFVAAHKRRSFWRWFAKFDPAAHNVLLRALVWSGLWLQYLVLWPRALWRQRRSRISAGG